MDWLDTLLLIQLNKKYIIKINTNKVNIAIYK